MSKFHFTQTDVQLLESQAQQLRLDIVSMIYTAKAGHPGGSLSAVEMVTALYFHVMNIDPSNPDWPERDRLFVQGSRLSRIVCGTGSPGIFRPRPFEYIASVQVHTSGAP